MDKPDTQEYNKQTTSKAHTSKTINHVFYVFFPLLFLFQPFLWLLLFLSFFPSSPVSSVPLPAPFPLLPSSWCFVPPSSAAGSKPAPSQAVPYGTWCSACSAELHLRLTPSLQTYRGTCSPSSAPAAAFRDPPCTGTSQRTPRRWSGRSSSTV